MFVKTIRFGDLANNSYLIGSEQSERCAIIDPVRDIDHHTTVTGSILRRDGRSNIQVVDESGTPAWINKGYPVSTSEQ